MPTSKGLPGNRQFAAEWVEKDSQDNAMAKAVRAAGRMRQEGRDGVVKDGDMLNVRFSV